MNNLTLRLDGPDLRRIADDVLVMMLPPNLRRRWMARMGRMVIAQAKRNVAEQKTVDGSPMTPRKDRTNREKMLTGLVKSSWIGVKLPSDDEAEVGFFRNAGIVANKHQLGGRAVGATYMAIDYPGVFDLAKIPADLKGRRFTLPDGRQGCSANHAAMLLRLRYVPLNLRAGLPSGGAAAIRYLMERVGRRQALFLIGRGAEKAGKLKRPDNTPARPFLGIDDEQKLAMGDELMNGIYDRFKAKSHAALLK